MYVEKKIARTKIQLNKMSFRYKHYTTAHLNISIMNLNTKQK